MNASAAHRKRKRERWECMRSYVCIYICIVRKVCLALAARRKRSIDRRRLAMCCYPEGSLSLSIYRGVERDRGKKTEGMRSVKRGKKREGRKLFCVGMEALGEGYGEEEWRNETAT